MISKIIKNIENGVYENKLQSMFSKLPLQKREELLNVKKEDVDTTNMTLGLICFYLIMLLLVLVAVMPSGHSFTTEETVAYNKLFTSGNLSEQQQIVIYDDLESYDDSQEIQDLQDNLEDNLTLIENRLSSQDKTLKSFNETLIEFLENQEELEEEIDSSEERKQKAQEQRELLQEYYECQSTEAFSLIKLCDSIYPEFAGLNIQNQNSNSPQVTQQNLTQEQFNELYFNLVDEDSFDYDKEEDLYSIPSFATTSNIQSLRDDFDEELNLYLWWNSILTFALVISIFFNFSRRSELPQSSVNSYDGMNHNNEETLQKVKKEVKSTSKKKK